MSARALLLGMAVTTTGQLWTWGVNGSGQLGLGNTTTYSSPKQVGALTNWTSVSGGFRHVLAVKSDGTLWAWGDNSIGQLGLGNTTSYSSPVQVGALTNWSKVSANGATALTSFSLAIKTDGTLWAWGKNASYGQLGLNNATDYSSPKQVGALTTWSLIGSGGAHTIAIKTDGTLWTWGRGSTGRLGLGNVTNYSSPKQVGALTTWSSTATFVQSQSTLAITTGGALWAWGYNTTYGQLGLGNTTSYSSPVQVGALTTWSKLLGANQFNGGITTGGALWMWGRNNLGQLGLGNTTNYSSPKQVGALTTWSNGACGAFHTMLIKTDNTIWGMGQNSVAAAGALGDNTTTDRSSPVQAVGTPTWVKVSAGGIWSMGLT